MKKFRQLGVSLVRWFDSDYRTEDFDAIRARPDRVEWVRCIPFLILHLGCLGVLFVGWSWFAVAVAAFLYFARMFAVTGVYHRYFSHRSYRTSRPFQFLLALFGSTTTQRGPLWWAYHHRMHHKHSDEEEDAHSPGQHGFLWSHIGWITSTRNFPTDYRVVKDFAKYPELVFLNRFDSLVPVLTALGLFLFGVACEAWFPQLGTNGWQMLVWGFFISTTLLFHGTCTINSLAHLIGRKRFDTGDDSCNSWILAFVTLGEGWHNNHHHYMNSARQGFYWWEIDITYYLLKTLSWTGLIWDLRPVPIEVKEAGRKRDPVATR